MLFIFNGYQISFCMRYFFECGMTVGMVMRFRIGVRNDCAFYSPPLEGWLTKEDGVVFISGWCPHQPLNCLVFYMATRNLLLYSYEILCRSTE